ncbi:MAG TPA: aspartyl-phosphate phosphatase Spo0E family protein [Chitinophagaceae bacterium]|nr:aspartyl-phosphate phosphatase Spo0E family protein [Chitinophagaceae bacterium]
MSNVNQQELIKLKKQIVAGRQKLQSLWNIRGCTDEMVLAAGIELDNLLNEYQRLQAQKRI